MATSKELESYLISYIDALTDILEFARNNNPHFGYNELRNISLEFRNAEQMAIVDIEQRPLSAGSFKHDILSRYAPFFHNNFFIKYYTFPAGITVSQNVRYVFLEKVVRQNSGAHNANFIDKLPSIDI